MLKKLKKLSAATVVIIVILTAFGGFTLARTVRNEIVQIMTSEESIQAAVEDAVRGFSNDYEQLIPHERKMNTLIYYATGIFNSNHVIWGEEDWLFYASKNSGDPIADYEGTNSYSTADLEQAKNNMLQQQTSLEDQGIAFCLLIPPNKEQVYAQYMPAKYIQATESRTDILTDYLAQSGVNCVDPKDALMDCNEAYRTYYKLDTHWNQLGAYIGIKETLDTFGIGLPALTDSAIVEGDSTAYDLADMVGLTSVFPTDYGFRMAFTASHTDSMTSEELGVMTHWHNDQAQVDSSLLLIGDSFRSAMIPVLRSVFKDFYVVHRSNYQPEMMDTADPDYVILEIVERHSDQVLDYRIG